MLPEAGRLQAHRMAGLHWKDRPRAARVALYTPKLSRKPRTVAMIMKADTAKRFSLQEHILFSCMGLLPVLAYSDVFV